MTRTSLAALTPIAIMLAACSPDTPADTAATPPSADEAGEMADTDTGMDKAGDDTAEMDESVGGLALQQVTSADATKLTGEIGCAFATSDDTSLMVAKADVGDDARASAAINNNGTGIMLTSESDGGFGALESSGGTFTGEGFRVTLTPGERAAEDGTETVTQSAGLTVQKTDGGERTYQGNWVCGP